MGDIHNQDQYLTGGAELKASDGTTLVSEDGVETIADDAVDSDAIATGAVDSDEIKDGAVKEDELGAKAVTAAKISLTEGSIFRGTAGGVAQELAKGSAYQILQMDGAGSNPNWETPPQYVWQSADVFITAAELKALRATPKEIVPAPGGGQGIQFLTATLEMRIGSDQGVDPYVEGGNDLAFKLTDGAGQAVSTTIDATGFIDAAANSIITADATASFLLASTAVDGQKLVLHNAGAGEYTGNAANDAELRVRVVYRTFQV